MPPLRVWEDQIAYGPRWPNRFTPVPFSEYMTDTLPRLDAAILLVSVLGQSLPHDNFLAVACHWMRTARPTG